MNIFETYDIGLDRRTRVVENDYQLPFKFAGKINKLNVKLGQEQLADDDKFLKQNILASINY